jgi:hypothetical protein
MNKVINKHTPGPWEFAADSYGKVQHSRKACVYTTVKGSGGERLVNIAQRIENWHDAKLIAAAPIMKDGLADALDFICLLAMHPKGQPIIPEWIDDAKAYYDRLKPILRDVEGS